MTATWDISAEADSGAVTATLYDDGTLAITGTGDTADYTSSSSVPWYTDYRTTITSVTIGSGVTPDNLDYYFYSCTALTSVFTLPDSVTSCRSTYRGCTSLATLPDDYAIGSAMIDCYYMFYGCTALTALPDGFTIGENVTTCSGMFSGCSTLASLPDGFAIGKSVENCSSMLSNCKALTALPDGFSITGSVTNCQSMFSGDSVLASLPEGFTIGAGVTTCQQMFYNCTSLTALPDGFAIGDAVTTVKEMFRGCSALASLPEGFTVSGESLTTCEGMFRACTALESLPDGFGYGDTVATCSYVFYGCTALTSLPDGYTVGSNATTCSYMFYGCTALESLPASLSIPSGVTTAASMFYNCTSLTCVHNLFADATVGSLSAASMFYGCTSLTVLHEGFTITGIKTTTNMFKNTSGASLTTYCSSEDYAALSAAYSWSGSTRTLSVSDEKAGHGYEAVWEWADDLSSAEVTLTCSVCGDVQSAEVTVTSAAGDDGTTVYTATATYDDVEYTDTATAVAWDISAYSDGSVIATLYDGGLLAITGEGDTLVFSSASAVPWADYRDSIVSVTLEDAVTPASLDYYFYGCTSLASIPTLPSCVTSLANTFRGCTSLASLPEGFTIGANVTSCKFAFYGCTSLASLPKGFTIGAAVTDCSYMFSGCTSLTLLPDGFALGAAVQDCQSMFSICEALEALPSDFTVGDAVTNCRAMFYDCRSLAALPEGFSIGDAVTTCVEMFRSCTSLASLPTGFSIGDAVTTCEEMFRNCSSLTALPDGFVLGDAVATSNEMFRGCTSLASIPADVAAGDALTESSYMFYGCTALAALPDGFALGSAVEKCLFMFSGCTSLVELPSGFAIPASVTSCASMFSGCTSLGSVLYAQLFAEATVSTLIASNMFYDCPSVNVLHEGFDISSIYKTANMFGQSYGSSAVITYCAASDYEALGEYNWSGSYRTLVASDERAAHSSDGEPVVTDPTCTEAGYTTYTCSVCGVEYTADETTATGHIPGDAVVEDEVAASCTEDGSYDSVVYCTVCGEELSRETVTVAAAGHDYAATGTVEPTCTEAGYTAYTCTVCGDSYTADETAALGHTAADAVVEDEVAATASQAGSYDLVVYCSVCGEELSRETVEVAALGYDFSDVQDVSAYYYGPVYAVAGAGYMTGMSDDVFGVGRSLNRQQMVTILYRIFASAGEQAAYGSTSDSSAYADNQTPLTDVEDGAYYTAAVDWAYDTGVTTGYSTGAFGVGDECSFQQFCTFLARALGEDGALTDAEAAGALSSFADGSKVAAYADNSVAYLCSVAYDDEGSTVVGGTAAGKLKPASSVSRERTATVVYRCMLAGLF